MADYILNIESSTGVCSVSISSGNDIVSFRESKTDRSHASMLTVFIEEVMEESGIGTKGLAAVAVSSGPGSYTGLRIGTSAAKGICYAADLPLIAVNTLALMTQMVLESPDIQPGEDSLLCPMIDARRMEVYTALFDASGKQTTDISAEIITGNTFRHLLDERKILFCGDGAEKCMETIDHKNAVFVPGIYPSAVMMAAFASSALKEGRIENTAYFTPFYLKDFLTTIPKRKMF